MEEIYPYLFRTEAYGLFAFGSFKVSAYLLLRPEGNLLIYSSKKIESYFSFIEEKGGLKANFITHVHEASKYCNIVSNRFNVPFYSPELESVEISKSCRVDKTYKDIFQYDNTFEIVSTPGHTVGSSCFIWTAPDGKIILFTGDNLYPTGKNIWDGFALHKDDIPQIIDSLRKIQAIKLDVVVPAGHSVENLFYKEVNREEWLSMCDGAIKRMEKQL